ncbi:MAG: hypothetical protein ABWX62_03070 [Microterricola sp.]
MSEKTTYTAVLFGPGMIGHGDEMQLEYVNGAYQPEIVISYDEPGGTITRTWRLGHETAEPVPYRFVSEQDAGAEAHVEN